MAVGSNRPFGGAGAVASSCSHSRIFTAIISRFASRRAVFAFFSRFASMRFIFAVAAVSLICAKTAHIYAHTAALTGSDVAFWGLTFYSQDTALLLSLRLLLDGQVFSTWRWLRYLAAFTGCLVTAVLMIMATVHISFFAMVGTELHWRNIGFVGDKTSRGVLLSGLISSILTGLVLLGASWVLHDICYVLSGIALDVLKWPVVFALSKLPFTRNLVKPNAVAYAHIPQGDAEEAMTHEPKDDDETKAGASDFSLSHKTRTFIYLAIGILLTLQIFLTMVRPAESSLAFLSWTLPLLPLVDFAHSSPSLAGLLPFYGNSINRKWDSRTALAPPIPYSWLPKDEPLAGFEDWYQPGKKHYSAEHDPMKISNMEDDLIEGLRGKLDGVKIRNIILLKMESTRKDVFPIKKDGFIRDLFLKTGKGDPLPPGAEERIASLTPTANYMTGDYEDGFEHKEKKRRGGLNFNNAFTTATYTRKSVTGTLCGITPLVADFNVEFKNHIYQPCLPQIFEAFNRLKNDSSSESNEETKRDTDDGYFTSYKWRSSMMQSITDAYDNEQLQLPFLGYDPKNFVYKEYLKSKTAKFGPVEMPDINYYGMAEVAIEKYIRDAFVTAKKDKERVFLTHLTSTTHHPFAMPEDEEYVALGHGKGRSLLSHYCNAVGYVDRWVNKIMTILDEEGVADETLVVLVGDHGISIAENSAVTPYYGPNIGNFHVPLVVSHPKLPPITIDTAVQSLQILPTILDLLQETKSLSSVASQAALDLAKNYEGQSLIRPLHTSNNKTSQGDWQFTVMNPGRALLSVRDTRHPEWRIVVPAVENIEWRFTNLEHDPHERKPTVSFGFFAFLKIVEEKHSLEIAKWAEEAAFMTRWWIEENRKRYRLNAEVIQVN